MDKVVNDMKNNGNNIMEKEAKDRIMITLTSNYESLALCSPATAPNLIEAVPESNKHENAVTRK